MANLPLAYQRYLEWPPSRLIHWAETVGPATAVVVTTILHGRPHPEQGYRSCLGVLRLSRVYGELRLEAACQRAQTLGAFAYNSVQSILKTGLDQQPLTEPGAPRPLPVDHAHLRGTTYDHEPSTQEPHDVTPSHDRDRTDLETHRHGHGLG